MKNILVVNDHEKRLNKYADKFEKYYMKLFYGHERDSISIDKQIETEVDILAFIYTDNFEFKSKNEFIARKVKENNPFIKLMYVAEDDTKFDSNELMHIYTKFTQLEYIDTYKILFLMCLSSSDKYLLHNINLNTRKNLVMMVGLPRSGKTTFVNKFINRDKYTLLCSDQLRLSLYQEAYNKDREMEMWAMFKEMYNYFILDNRSIIIDATNVNYDNRKYYVEIAKKNGYDITIIHMNSLIEDCLKRCEDRPDLIKPIEYMNRISDYDFDGVFSLTI